MVWEKVQPDFSVELFEMQSSLSLVLGCFTCISWQGLRCRGRFLKSAKTVQSKGSLKGLKMKRREGKARADSGYCLCRSLGSDLSWWITPED